MLVLILVLVAYCILSIVLTRVANRLLLQKGVKQDIKKLISVTMIIFWLFLGIIIFGLAWINLN